MKNIKSEYPIPVLLEENDDYLPECKFDAIVENKEVDSDHIKLLVKIDLQCNGLKEMIENGDAKISIFANSEALFFGKSYDLNGYQETYELKIPKFNVKKQVVITGYIISTIKKDRFYLNELNHEYFNEKDVSLKLNPGDILAKGNSWQIAVDDTELEKPFSSIFSINKLKDNRGFTVSYDEDKINIWLEEEIYKFYFRLKDHNNGKLRDFITGLIFFPVVSEAVKIILDKKEEDQEYSDKFWYKAISKKIEKVLLEQGKNIEEYEDSTVELANKLLGDIVKKALNNVYSTIKDEVEIEE